MSTEEPQIAKEPKHRNAALTAIISLVFGITTGALYLNRGRLAFHYFLAAIFLFGLPFLLTDVLLFPLDPAIVGKSLVFALGIGGTIHCARLAKKSELGPLKWYAPAYVAILGFWVLPLFVVLCFRGLVLEPFNIPSGSMAPNAIVGDNLFVSKFAYGYSSRLLPFSLVLSSGRIFESAPARGDVIVFLLPQDNKTPYIKRVIGLPGDTVQMKDGRLFINDTLMERERIDDYIARDTDGSMMKSMRYKEMLPGGKVDIILEERDDARFDNTPEFKVPPGHYFTMGDNRDHSADSRSGVGYVPTENIVGKATFVFWNSRYNRFTFRSLD